MLLAEVDPAHVFAFHVWQNHARAGTCILGPAHKAQHAASAATAGTGGMVVLVVAVMILAQVKGRVLKPQRC